MEKIKKIKLSNSEYAIGADATNITTDSNHRFVSDSQISTWNNKPNNKANIGLGNVTNDAQVKRSEMGKASGVATLDTAGKVPSSQLPSYVDDVIEVSAYSKLPAKGETGKIYITLDTNKTYRWSGTAYVVISETLALGTTSSTAYRGDLGNTAYSHSQVKSGNPHGVTKADVGLGNVNNTADSAKHVAYAASAGSAGSATNATNASIATNIKDAGDGRSLQVNYSTPEADPLYFASWIKSGVLGSSNATQMKKKLSLSKSDVGLSNVDNTADANKSVNYAKTAGTAKASDVYSWAKASTKPSYSKSEIGLGNVDNTADVNKSVKYATSSNIANYLAMNSCSNKDFDKITTAGYYYGYEGMTHAKFSDSISVLEVIVYSGDWIVQRQTNINGYGGETWQRTRYNGTTWSNWTPIYSGSNKPSKSDIGLSNVNNTADSQKSVNYANTAGTAKASDVYSWAKASTKPSYSKSEVGLGNVDNTADSSKHVDIANRITTEVGGADQFRNVFFAHSSSNNKVTYNTTIQANPAHGGILKATRFQGKADTAGTADKANAVAWSNVSGKPGTYPPSSHNHTSLDLTSATVSKRLTIGHVAEHVCDLYYPSTSKEILIKTKIPFVSGNHMPVIHIYGYAYGLTSPIELKLAYYIYDNQHGWSGVVSMGAWQPKVQLFSYLENGVKYTGIALIGQIYFPQFSVNLQMEMGSGHLETYSQGWKVETLAADSGTSTLIPKTDVVTVPYKSTFSAEINGHTFNGLSNINITKTDIGLGSVNNTADSVKDVKGAMQLYDYNATSTPIKIGYSGSGLGTTDYFAAYSTTNGIRCIKDISIANTKTVLGISNVTNDSQVKRSEMGKASGVATLSSAGKVPASQLPSSVKVSVEADTLLIECLI